MRSYRFRWVATLLGLVALAIAQSAPQTPEANPGTTARVLVTIASGGRPPSKSNLAAFVDSRPAQITEVVPANGEQLIFAVLIDVSSSSRDKQAFEKKSSLELFRALSTRENVGYFGDFDDEVYLENKPANVESINAELKRIGVFRGGTAFHDAVYRATQLISKTSGQASTRRAVFVLTDGEDNASTRTLKETVKQAQGKGVAVFCVGLLGPLTSKKAADRLRMLSDATGGTALLLTGADNFVPSILEALQNQFWMTVAIPAVGDRNLHELTVTSTDANVHISSPAQIFGR